MGWGKLLKDRNVSIEAPSKTEHFFAFSNRRRTFAMEIMVSKWEFHPLSMLKPLPTNCLYATETQ